ncbi:tol-pal system protein YbgF [Phaeovulum veldkampii DSM 11550]|nr:tol-pal system protein YbgF [Phaeovulum veldkampii DSM 11550]
MMRAFGLKAALALGLTLALPQAGLAQASAQTLADIRAELGQLSAQIQGLRSELLASGQSGLAAAGGASALERMNTMEAALSRLTAQAEALENRVNRVVADGTNRLGDLEFRLCEIEPGCDIGALGAAAPLGGSGAQLAAPAAPAATGSFAMNEQADFDRAREVLGQGDFRGAADLFAAFAQTYTGGPLTGEAMYLRGQALAQAGDTAGAARAWLEAFSAAPDGPRAADNLLALGQSLGDLGQRSEACATLAEVGFRFPASPAAAQAASVRQGLSCP